MLDMRAIIGQLYIYLADFTALSQSSKQGTNAVFRGVLKSELPSEISVASMLESPDLRFRRSEVYKEAHFLRISGSLNERSSLCANITEQ